MDLLLKRLMANRRVEAWAYTMQVSAMARALFVAECAIDKGAFFGFARRWLCDREITTDKDETYDTVQNAINCLSADLLNLPCTKYSFLSSVLGWARDNKTLAVCVFHQAVDKCLLYCTVIHMHICDNEHYHADINTGNLVKQRHKIGVGMIKKEYLSNASINTSH